jgi:hypothetical protein
VHFDVVCSRDVGQARSRPTVVLLTEICMGAVGGPAHQTSRLFIFSVASLARPGMDEYYEKVRVKRGEILTDWFVGGQRGASAPRARQARRQYGRGEQA